MCLVFLKALFIVVLLVFILFKLSLNQTNDRCLKKMFGFPKSARFFATFSNLYQRNGGNFPKFSDNNFRTIPASQIFSANRLIFLFSIVSYIFRRLLRTSARKIKNSDFYRKNSKKWGGYHPPPRGRSRVRHSCDIISPDQFMRSF